MTNNLIRLSILILAGFSTTSSVIGLSEVFKGAQYPVMVVAVGLELGKYASVSYAYKEWSYLAMRFKVLLVVFIAGISILTSVGVFGYLGNSFQIAHSKAQKTEIDITILTTEKQRLDDRMKAIDIQVSELPKEFVNGRLKLMLAFADERKEVSDNIKVVSNKLLASKISSINTLDDLGPIVYLAQTFRTTVENAVGNMMLALTIALDPFALFLTILLNRPKHIELRKVGRPRKTVEKFVKKVKAKVVKAEAPVKQEDTMEWNFK